MQLTIACDKGVCKLGDEVFITVGLFKTKDGRPMPPDYTKIGADVGFVNKITEGRGSDLIEIGY